MQYIEEDKELNEINVTPFIDIMLVLLIIFMAVTPIVTNSLKVELPRSSEQSEEKPKNPIVVYINKNGEVAINDIKTTLEKMNFIINDRSKNNKEEIIYFHIDKTTQYEQIMQVIDKIREEGYVKIALVSQKKQ
ncbi:biopolymer transporter ExbD [Campylobacter insulaenigrae]|uniref:ExbD/TolR family protein n=1 Tax=Campylobacter insulaenigrae TaxID=260714 RepID=UPI00215224E4|nr:biopolymer transporter ExbD [Campylobacter insulaenigrae]MCR6584307.1 biopolymer transporter ExbD [Campylobacter insulaenigrae]